MDSFEYNKLIGALLGTVFVVFSIGLVSDWLFAAPAPEKPGYVIEAAEEDAGGGAATEKAEVVPIAVRLASADVAKGETVFKKCHACHDGTKGGPNKVGPNLWGVVNRPVAAHEGFAYSSGMKAFAEGGTVWDYEHLDKFLTSPKNDVKGTAMGFAGLKDPQDRGNIIAYLRTLADEPAPLPEVTAAPAAENASAPAGDAAVPAEGEKAPAGDAAPAK